jgi:tetratricopeptide (TPR) repeat protein
VVKTLKGSGMSFHWKSEDSDMTEENVSAKMDQAKQKESEAAERTGKPEDLRQLLIKAGETDDYEDKLRLFDKALTLDPLYLDAWIQKGFALDRMGKSKEALACYDKALEIDPENLGVRCLKGFAFNNLKEFEKSIESYDEVLKVNPDDVFALYQKGSSLESLGRYGEAMQCYDKALDIDPADALIREKKMRLLGLIYKKGTLVDSPDSRFN